MIDGARRFAVRWLLEPTAAKEYTYEYNFRLAVYTVGELTFKRDDTTYLNTYSDTYRTYVNSHSFTEITTSPDMVVPQAKIYRIDPNTNTKEYLGMVEYFLADADRVDSEYSDYSTGISETKNQYIYFLGPISYALGRFGIMITKTFEMVTDYSTGDLILKREITDIYPSESISTLTVTDSTTWSYQNKYKYIKIKGLSTPAWTSKRYTAVEDESGITTEEIDLKSQPAENSREYSFYPGMRLKPKNYFDYQEQLNIALDERLNFDYLVKCSEGLDYDTFVNLCSLTSDFSKNTTITSEHD